MDDAKASRAVELHIHGKTRLFDVDDPVLPDWVKDGALGSGGYPYKKKVKDEDYLKELAPLQAELVKVQFWLQATGKRVLSLFEGRDAAGKGGAIAATSAHMNPRLAARRGADQADGARTRSVVFPALCRTVSDRGRIRAVRPLLVQPGRCRAGHGLLHGRTVRALPRSRRR